MNDDVIVKAMLISFIKGWIEKTEQGSTVAASNLLWAASTFLCNDNEAGKLLRDYIQKCLKK